MCVFVCVCVCVCAFVCVPVCVCVCNPHSDHLTPYSLLTSPLPQLSMMAHLEALMGVWTAGCWQASLSGNTHTYTHMHMHTRTRTHAPICTMHCVLRHNTPWSFFTSFHSLFIIAPLETRSLSVHAISLCSKSMTLCACVCVCVCSCSVSSHAYLPLGLRTSLKMFVFMPCAGGLESNLHLCVRACVYVCVCVCVCVCVRHGDDEGVGDSRILARGSSRQMWET